tara:strand:+ start:411 stop:569 length:159 start_codon:yes stop_codon:yes gene_type:complete
MVKSAAMFLEECDYISQDGDTVYIDEEALIATMELYAFYCYNEKGEKNDENN